MSFRRHLMALLLLALAGSGLVASGISTHFESADRARAEVDAFAFPELAAVLAAHPQELRVGAVYPDWGYLWPATSQAAEDSHWAPYHTVAAGYLHDVYGEPWSPHAERLYAYLCGLVAHGAMDEPWHFGPQAFLGRAHDQDLACLDPDLSAWVIEASVDLMVQAEHRPGAEEPEWWIPEADLVAIAARAGHPEVDAASIRLGSTIQRVAAWVEDLLGPGYGPVAAFVLPWTAANYEQWPAGGLDHGSALAARRLEAYWLEYQALTRSPGAPPLPGPIRQPHVCGSPERMAFAAELLEQGLVSVPVTAAGHGAVRLGEPLALHPEELARRLDELRRAAAAGG